MSKRSLIVYDIVVNELPELKKVINEIFKKEVNNED